MEACGEGRGGGTGEGRSTSPGTAFRELLQLENTAKVRENDELDLGLLF
jgi:hypothetical protein